VSGWWFLIVPAAFLLVVVRGFAGLKQGLWTLVVAIGFVVFFAVAVHYAVGI
jgi:hypothetical protein